MQKITRANRVKFFGVLLDEALCWKFHLIELSRRLSRSVGIFNKLRHFVPKETLKNCLLLFFYPFLSYGIVVFSML